MSFLARASSNRAAVLAVGLTLSALVAGCANRTPASPPVSEISSPQTVKVAYQGAACNRLAPQLVSLARQEYEISSGKGKRSAGAATLADTRQQKEEIRTEMRANGCF